MNQRNLILACDLRNRRYVVAAGAAAVVIIVIIVVVVGVAVVVAVVVVLVDFVAIGVVAPSWMSFSANAYMVASAHAVFDDRFTSLLLGTRVGLAGKTLPGHLS